MSRISQFSLEPDERQVLEGLVRQRKANGLVVRRANALLLLDDGMSASDVGRVLYLDVGTIRLWRSRFAPEGLASLEMKGYRQREGHLTRAQEAALMAHLATHPPRNTNEVREHIRRTYEQDFSRSGAIKLMARLGFEYRKPVPVPAVADETALATFIREYESLLNSSPDDEAVLFSDAVHPEYLSRPAYGWFPKGGKPAVKTKSGRKRVNIQGTLNLETFDFRFVQGEKINAQTTRQLLTKIETAYPAKRVIHVFLDNARYHYAKALQPWLEAPKRRVKLHFLPKRPISTP